MISFEVTHNTTNCLLTHDMTVYASQCCFDDNFAINATYNSEGATLEADLNTHYPGIASYDVDKKELQIDFNIISPPDQLFVNGKWAPEYSVKITGYEFTGSELSMSEGAQLDVLSHHKFTIYGCNLHACTEKQWRGIKLQYNSAIKTEFYDTGDPQVPRSIISDAEYAVTANNLTKADLQHTDFINNHVGFYIPPMVQFSYNTVDLLNRANTFSSDGNMLNEYMGQTTLTAGHHSYAGMLLNNFNGVIGLKESTNPLNFNHINNGILAFNCNLMVTTCKFRNIKYYDYGPPAFKMFAGSAIFAHGDGKGLYSLSQEGLGKTNNNATFDNCRIGVIGVRTTLDISENKMTEMESGISNYMSMLRSVNIYNNSIFTSINGIHSSFGNLSTELNIHDNDVTLNNTSGNTSSAAISVDENPSFGNSNTIIYDNELTVTSGGNGILLNTTNLTKVNNNTITLNDEINPVNGIRANTCKEIDILINTITGTGGTVNDNSQTAISTNATTLSSLFNNNTFLTNIGLYFSGYCDDTYMECNDMEDHVLGTKMEVLGRFKHPHDLMKNDWKGAYATWGFEYLGTDPIFDKFTAGPAPKTPPTGKIFPSNFFGPGTESDDCDQSSPLSSVFDSLDYVIARGTIPVEEFEEEMDYISKSNLYYKADKNQDSIPAESAIDSFYTANQTTSIGLFHALEKHAKIVFSLDSATTQIMKNTDSLVVAVLKEMAFNDSLRYSGVSYDDSLSLVEVNYMLKDSIHLMMKNYQAFWQAIDTLNILYSDSLIAENASISTSMTIESNLKTLNSIYYNTITKGIYEFDSTQAANIFEIATQCPLSGGKAVAIAQTMYRLVNDTLAFASDTSCSGASPRLSKSSKPEISSFIYPNPTTNSATLFYSLPLKSSGWFIIYDILGNEKQRFELNYKISNKKFSCEQFGQGLYYYKIVDRRDLISYGKFSVIR